MLSQNRIQRHGYHLMSLASLGILIMAVVGLVASAIPHLPDWSPQWSGWNLAGLSWQQAVAMSTQGKALLSLACIAGTLANLIPLIALRLLGKRLYRHDALTRPVADAFRWLAHSLLLYALLHFVAAIVAEFAVGVGGGDAASLILNFSVGGAYLFLVASLCLYSIAHIMRLATEAADDSRSIV